MKRISFEYQARPSWRRYGSGTKRADLDIAKDGSVHVHVREIADLTRRTQTIKLYHHQTDGGASYLADKFKVCPDGRKEGVFENAVVIVRLDGHPELSIPGNEDLL
jgi:predicted  nucleic acid-binding Zn ribbon protein